MRTSAEVIRLVNDWLDGHRELFPDFAGAYLFGSLIHQPADAPFHSYRDVDLIIVQKPDSPVRETNLEIFHEGLMIEVGFQPIETLGPPAAILANPEMAANVSATRILADPFNVLVPLQAEVRRCFADRQWVQARCDAEMQLVQRAIADMARMESHFEKSLALWNTCSGLTGLVALARLRPPTHRRSLALCKAILTEQQRLDLHEQILRLWGSAHLSRLDVEALLKGALEVFDLAVAIYKTPIPFGFKLHPHLRPYFQEGAQEMISEGSHREATFWIALPITVGFLAATADGSVADQQRAGARYQEFVTAHQMETAIQIAERVDFASLVAQDVGVLATEMISRYSA